MIDLIEFLLARIAEDEERARVAAAHPNGDFAVAALPMPVLEFVASNGPTRVLAECASKRLIIGSLDLSSEPDRGEPENHTED